jgi:hypothetical protein
MIGGTTPLKKIKVHLFFWWQEDAQRHESQSKVKSHQDCKQVLSLRTKTGDSVSAQAFPPSALCRYPGSFLSKVWFFNLCCHLWAIPFPPSSPLCSNWPRTVPPVCLQNQIPLSECGLTSPGQSGATAAGPPGYLAFTFLPAAITPSLWLLKQLWILCLFHEGIFSKDFTDKFCALP